MDKKRMIYSLSDLIDEVDKLDHSRVLWYRGHSDINWELIPSVQRAPYKDREQFLANDFYMKASVTLHEKPDYRNYSAWLSIMRHYGLPTRLLDWSASPLVAAYFAVESWKEEPDVDGCIWVLSPSALNSEEGFNEYLYSIDSHTALQMIRPAFKAEYEPGNPNVKDSILACYPIENDLRIYVQQSAFTLHNTNRKLIDVPGNDILRKIIIPKEAKERIFRELKLMGFSLSHIYPDASHIATELSE
ncbi:MAG: FRG domain-containing protein [Lachnospiraceae bacterium]|nr:FRG domain-containing protein [Lachnospiraceae bacterium]